MRARGSKSKVLLKVMVSCLALFLFLLLGFGCSTYDSVLESEPELPDGLHNVPSDSQATYRSEKDSCRFDFTPVTSILKDFSDDRNLGIGFTIFTADRVLYEGYFGDYTADTTEPLASASKMPSTLAVMTLVDEGWIDLDDPVAPFLDFWPADKASITLRQLLSHTSGLPSLSLCLGNPWTSVAQCAQQVAGLRLQGDPGTVFRYGGNGLQIAGRLAELHTGLPWREFFAQRLAQPLGLETYSFFQTPNPMIAWGARSNVRDYARILQLHLARGQIGSNRLLSDYAIDQMQQDHLEGLNLEMEYHYGLGWWIIQPPEGLAPTEFSDQGGFGSVPWIDTKRGYGAFILIRDVTATGIAIRDAVRPLIRQQMDNCR